jgi:uncharacterized protein with HEPN domain
MRSEALYLTDILEATRSLIANRNFIVHGYFSISWNIVWETATEYAMPLQEKIFSILKDEFPDW